MLHGGYELSSRFCARFGLDGELARLLASNMQERFGTDVGGRVQFGPGTAARLRGVPASSE